METDYIMFDSISCHRKLDHSYNCNITLGQLDDTNNLHTFNATLIDKRTRTFILATTKKNFTPGKNYRLNPLTDHNRR